MEIFKSLALASIGFLVYKIISHFSNSSLVPIFLAILLMLIIAVLIEGPIKNRRNK